MIYGSHNTCTYSPTRCCLLEVAKPWIKNQSKTIAKQMQLGVQWYDLRLSHVSKSPTDPIYLSHTILFKLTFEKAMEQIKLAYLASTLPYIIIEIRVDFHDIENAPLLQPRINSVLEKYQDLILTKSEVAALHTIGELESFCRAGTKKWLLYTSDKSVTNEFVTQKVVMPLVDCYNEKDLDAVEKKLQKLDELYKEAMKDPSLYIFPGDKMLNFDYSSALPLRVTDCTQRKLMRKYKSTILAQKLSVLAGNYVQEIQKIFQE